MFHSFRYLLKLLVLLVLSLLLLLLLPLLPLLPLPLLLWWFLFLFFFRLLFSTYKSIHASARLSLFSHFLSSPFHFLLRFCTIWNSLTKFIRWLTITIPMMLLIFVSVAHTPEAIQSVWNNWEKKKRLVSKYILLYILCMRIYVGRSVPVYFLHKIDKCSHFVRITLTCKRDNRTTRIAVRTDAYERYHPIAEPYVIMAVRTNTIGATETEKRNDVKKKTNRFKDFRNCSRGAEPEKYTTQLSSLAQLFFCLWFVIVRLIIQKKSTHHWNEKEQKNKVTKYGETLYKQFE